MTSLALLPVFTGPDPQSKMAGLLRQLVNDRGELAKLDRYYRGAQPLQFLAPEIQRKMGDRLKSLVVNWPRLVVNSLEERLDVDGFRLAANQTPDADLWRIWQANDLDEASQLAHVDALVHGRSFAIVWADPDDPLTPKITVESAEQMWVEFAPGTTTVINAVKHWSQDDTTYCTLYTEDAIHKFMAPASKNPFYNAYPMTGWDHIESIGHDLGVCPVVAFINSPRLTHPYGESELTDVIPLADAINKLATDMMVSAEFHAMPRRWATGLDLGEGDGADTRTVELVKQRWTDAAPGNVWLSENPATQFGQFASADLKNFVAGIEMLAAQVAAVTALPPHYVGLMSQANPASADAITSAETSLNHRAKRKMRVFGGAWERVMRLALLVLERPVDDARSMETIWRKPETPSVAQLMDAAVKADQIGVPFRQILEDLGHTPTQADRIIADRADDAIALAMKQLEAVDQIVKTYGISRAAALSVVGLQEAAKVEAIVEARAPGPGVTTNVELHEEVEAATPDVVPETGESAAADKADPPPMPVKAPMA